MIVHYGTAKFCWEAEGWPKLGLGLPQVVELRLGVLLAVAGSALEIPQWLFKIDMSGFFENGVKELNILP